MQTNTVHYSLAVVKTASAVFSDLAAPPQDLSCGPLPSALPALRSNDFILCCAACALYSSQSQRLKTPMH